MFLVSGNGFVELVIFTPFFTSLKARPPGNMYVNKSVNIRD